MRYTRPWHLEHHSAPKYDIGSSCHAPCARRVHTVYCGSLHLATHKCCWGIRSRLCFTVWPRERRLLWRSMLACRFCRGLDW